MPAPFKGWDEATFQAWVQADAAATKVWNEIKHETLLSNQNFLKDQVDALAAGARALNLGLTLPELPPVGVGFTPEWFHRLPVTLGHNAKMGGKNENFVEDGILIPLAAGRGYMMVKSLAFKLHVGNYAGDGNVGHAIVGVGFQPKVLFIQEDNNEFNPVTAHFTHKDGIAFGGGILTHSFDGSKSGRIQSLDADGFTLNTTGLPNEVGKTYSFFALESGLNDPTLKVKVDKYTGDGNANQVIDGFGFTPQIVFVASNISTGNPLPVVWTHRSSISYIDSFQVKAAFNVGINLEKEGFKARGNLSSTSVPNMNRSGVEYLYVAIRGGGIIT